MAKNTNKKTAQSGGNFYPNYDESVFTRTCEQEIDEPIEGKITGEIPAWLRGSLLRNGPGSFKVGDMKYKHLFDGSALLHRFSIADGKATYQCRFLRSETYKRNRAANRIVVTEFGTKSVPDPCHTIFDRIALRFQPEKTMSDNSTVSVYPFGDEIYALTEVPIIHRIDPVTLDTVERKNITNVVVTHTAHPHVMPNGDVYNTGLKVTNFKAKQVIVKFPFVEKGDMFKEAEVVGSMDLRWSLNPTYMHSFGITDNYFVIVDQPLTLSLPKLAVKTIADKPISGILKWNAECDTHIVLISRKTGKEVKRFATPSLFYMHIINAFEKDGTVTVDLCSYNDARIMDGMYIEALENLQSNPDYADWFRGRAKRVEVRVDAPNLSQANTYVLNDELTCEMPRINYDTYNGKPYRYFYALGSDVDCEVPGMMVKVDTKTGETLTWSERGSFGCEPVFVPAPDAKEEDDGVVLTVVLFSKRECENALVVLDARSMREIARAHFTTPSPAAKCLHGWFLPQHKHISTSK